MTVFMKADVLKLAGALLFQIFINIEAAENLIQSLGSRQLVFLEISLQLVLCLKSHTTIGSALKCNFSTSFTSCFPSTRVSQTGDAWYKVGNTWEVTTVCLRFIFSRMIFNPFISLRIFCPISLTWSIHFCLKSNQTPNSCILSTLHKTPTGDRLILEG